MHTPSLNPALLVILCVVPHFQKKSFKKYNKICTAILPYWTKVSIFVSFKENAILSIMKYNNYVIHNRVKLKFSLHNELSNSTLVLIILYLMIHWRLKKLGPVYFVRLQNAKVEEARINLVLMKSLLECFESRQHIWIINWSEH